MGTGSGRLDGDPGEVGVGRVEQDVCVVGQEDGGEPERDGAGVRHPGVAEALGRARGRGGAPTGREVVVGERLDEGVGDLDAEGDAAPERAVGREVDGDLEEREREGVGGVDDGRAGAVEPSAHETRALAVEGGGGVPLGDDAPGDHRHARTPWSIRWRSASTSRAPGSVWA